MTSQPTTDVTLATGNFTELVENSTTSYIAPEIVKYVPVSTTQIVILDIINYAKHPFQTYLYSSALVLAAISVFLRIGFLLKLVLMVTSVVVHILIYSYLDFFQEYHAQDVHDDEYVQLTILLSAFNIFRSQISWFTF